MLFRAIRGIIALATDLIALGASPNCTQKHVITYTNTIARLENVLRLQ